ncbi:MAG: AMP-dependent synthetase/ligase [Candidatus Bruticola sp.]
MSYAPFMSGIIANAEKYQKRTAYEVYLGDHWEKISWSQFLDNISKVASAVLNFGLADGDLVAIYAPNCPQWTEIDYGCMSAKAVTVAIHATCSSEAVQQIFTETVPKITFVGNAELADLLFECVSDTGHVVIIEGEHPRCQKYADFINVETRSDWSSKVKETKASDLWTIVYTSGTTGAVRGAMLTHGNIVYQIMRHRDRLPDLTDQDRSFCMLPLSHIFERGWSAVQYSWGMTYYYCKPSPEIIRLLPYAAPSVICVVPRILEKIYTAVYEKFSQRSKAMQSIVNKCVRIGCQYQKELIEGRTPGLWLRMRNKIADKLVFSKVRHVFGDHIKHLVVGSASLTASVHEFFRACGIFINNGYGMTETTATISSTPLGRSIPGMVGLPMEGIEIRLGQDNEIQVRGDSVMVGYYKKPEETKNSFTEDGFFRTGDVGNFAPNGYLCITDRIKDMIRTSTGKYVAPQYLESRLALSPLIEQAAVIGEGRSWVGALLVPNFSKLEEYAKKIGLNFESREDLVGYPEIISFVKSAIDDLLSDVAKHERVQRIALLTKPFTIQSGELTPTLKLRRKIILERYREQIALMDSFDSTYLKIAHSAG